MTDIDNLGKGGLTGVVFLGKGGLLDVPDPEDYQFSFIFPNTGDVVDWTKEFRLPEPPDTNQRSSDCCVGEASSFYHWQLTGKQYAVRSVFAYIAAPDGAYFRDGPKRITEFGQQTYEQVPDPDPKTEKNMRSKVGLDPNLALKERELSYYAASSTMDSIAQAVRNFKGCTVGLLGTNAGWSDLTNPKPPPSPGPGAEWGHDLYVFGYHMHDGQKCIIAKSSWCQAGHHEHHIKQNYEPFLSSVWILVPKKHMNRYVVNKGGKLGILVSEDNSFSDVVLWAKSEAMLAELKRQYEIPDNAPTITYP